MKNIAIIGAGPGGIACARFLKAYGFNPVLIDSHSGVGGQWDNKNPKSGIWPNMRTNTFREATRFADMPYDDKVAIFPRNGEVLDYFKKYCDTYGLTENARFNTTVTRLEKVEKGYALTLEQDGQKATEIFEKVVVASGRYNKPKIPEIEGLASFTGKLGVKHTFEYKDPEIYRGAHVVVAGGSISALEIASDLTMLGAASVHLAQRRQRYVMPKMVTGVPFEYYGFTYGGAAQENVDPEQAKRDQQDFALRYGGDPARYGAPAPDPDITKAGFTGSQHYLNLVAEARLTPVPWFKNIDKQTVTFLDGRQVEADALIIGTGFDLNLPYLSQDISETIELDKKGLTLSNFTFHPDLPDLAFIGFWSQNGPYPVPLELQARYLAYTWGGVLPPRSDEELRNDLALCRTEGHHEGYREQNQMALRFARLCGVDPAALGDEELMEHIRASATTGILYRMTGPDALEDGKEQFLKQFNRYIPS